MDKRQEVGEALGGDIQLLSRDGCHHRSLGKRMENAASGMPGAFRAALCPRFAVGTPSSLAATLRSVFGASWFLSARHSRE